MTNRAEIWGVDFSGAETAGKKIWISKGKIDSECQTSLTIEGCVRATELPGAEKTRESAMTALVYEIREANSAVIGLDFPFSIPEQLIETPSYSEFLNSFPRRYQTAEQFCSICKEQGDGNELKRLTDFQSKTPFSPYNLRLYRQTYYGIRDVLIPLNLDNAVSILPMQEPDASKPWLLEVCPASLLKNLNLYRPYKGRDKGKKEARIDILKELNKNGFVVIKSPFILSRIAEDSEGDALDSVIAAIAAHRATMSPDFMSVGKESPYNLEGFVYGVS
jgi:hypothetical protein